MPSGARFFERPFFAPGRSDGLEMGHADQRGRIVPVPRGGCTLFSRAGAGEPLHPGVVLTQSMMKIAVKSHQTGPINYIQLGRFDSKTDPR